jgi:hypothetical protein
MDQLQHLGELLVGATPGAAGSEIRLAKYVRAGDIREGEVVDDASDGPEPARGRNTQLAAGDIVVRGRGVPVAAMIAGGAEGAYPTNDVLLFRPDGAKADAGFVTTFLNLPRVRDALSAGSQGAALSRLSVQALGNLDIPLPPLATQRKIADLADCMAAEQRILEQLRELHRQLNQRILQQLLGNAHDEGGNPRRGSHRSTVRKDGRPVLT